MATPQHDAGKKVLTKTLEDHIKELHHLSQLTTSLAATVRDAMEQGQDHAHYAKVAEHLTNHCLRIEDHLGHLSQTMEGEAHAPGFDQDGLLWG